MHPTMRALALCLSLAAQSGIAQSPADTLRQARDFNALVTASNGTSAFCKGYVGKTVSPASFDALARRGGGDKDEFETTAQYRARQAVAPGGGPVVLALPTDRDFLHYDADDGAMIVQAGAFGTGRASEEPQASIAVELATPGGGSFVHYGQSQRVLRSYVARNGLGIPVRVSDVERTTRSVRIDAPRLFSFAQDRDSPVMGVAIAAAKARLLKQAGHVALVIEPKPPYAFTGEMPGAAPTGREPVRYTERTVTLAADARCGLLLDTASHVLASVDAG